MRAAFVSDHHSWILAWALSLLLLSQGLHLPVLAALLLLSILGVSLFVVPSGSAYIDVAVSGVVGSAISRCVLPRLSRSVRAASPRDRYYYPLRQLATIPAGDLLV